MATARRERHRNQDSHQYGVTPDTLQPCASRMLTCEEVPMTRTLVTLTFILLGPPLAMVSLAEIKTTKMGAKKKGSNGCVSFAEDDRVKLKKSNRDVVIFEVTNGCSEESTITIRALESGG